jgi:4-hydroxy-3-polyprenylbenzoate decarboxylase
VRLVVAMTGATGAVYGIRLLKALQHLGVERHVILSRWAEVTIVKETARDQQGSSTSGQVSRIIHT